jgi:hypothetical protein
MLTLLEEKKLTFKYSLHKIRASKIVPWFRQLVADLPPQSLAVDPRFDICGG